MQRLTRLFFTVVLFLSMMSVYAADHYVFDKSHTRIFFEVDHLGFSRYNGMFREFEGGFSFDLKDIEKSSVEVEIDLASVDGFHEGLNKHLRGADFFDVENYPIARFVSKKVKKVADNRFKVSGDLILKGVKKSVTLDVVLNKAEPHPMNKKYTAGFSASTVIDRSDFGMDYGVPALGKEVSLHIDVEGQRQDERN